MPEIQQKTQLSRASVYDSLTELLGLGFLEYRKEGRVAYYKLAHPNKLFDLIAEKKRDVQLFEQELGETVRAITGMYNLAQNKPGVRFFEGKDGIKEVTFDSLRSSGMIYTFADMDAAQKHAKDINTEYVAKRIQKKIFKKMIALDTPLARERYTKAPPADKLLEVRLLPAIASAPQFFQTGMQIYDNTISYSTLTDVLQVGVIIEDAHIAQMHRRLFEYIWGTLTPLPAEATPHPASPLQADVQ